MPLKKSLEIPNGVIRIRISKKNRQHNGRKKKYKRKGQTKIYKIHIKLKIE
jgi:peptidyl-tRNA hydrolase